MLADERRDLAATQAAVERLGPGEGPALLRLIFRPYIPGGGMLGDYLPAYGVVVLDQEAIEGLLDRSAWIEEVSRIHGMGEGRWCCQRLFLLDDEGIEALGIDDALLNRVGDNGILGERQFVELPDTLTVAQLQEKTLGDPSYYVRCRDGEVVEWVWYWEDLDRDLESPCMDLSTLKDWGLELAGRNAPEEPDDDDTT